MSLTTTGSLWCSLVTYSSHTSTFLLSWFFTTTRNISDTFNQFCSNFAFHVKVVVDFGHNIASQLNIEMGMIEIANLTSKVTTHKIIHWQL